MKMDDFTPPQDVLDKAEEIYQQLLKEEYPEDDWYGVGENWDANYWFEDSSDSHLTYDLNKRKYHCQIFKVISGETITDFWLNLH